MRKKLTSDNGAAMFMCQLSLERCAVYLVHLCASVHLLDDNKEDLQEIIAGMERELAYSRNLIGRSVE